jgi:hypothetical protein
MAKYRRKRLRLVYPEREQADRDGFFKARQLQHIAEPIGDLRRPTVYELPKCEARQPSLSGQPIGNGPQGASGQIEDETAFIHP